MIPYQLLLLLPPDDGGLAFEGDMSVDTSTLFGWLEYTVKGRLQYRVEGRMQYDTKGRLHYTPGSEE